MKRRHTKLLEIPYQVWLVLFIVAMTAAVLSLRSNNQQMIKLREAVYAADERGAGVEKALNNLRGYVYGHMNTNLASGGNAIKPPIQLKYTYERLLAVEQAKVETTNSKIYTQAQEYCQSQVPAGTSGIGRVPCVQDYVTSRGVKVNPVPAGLYQFDFLSPAWSPDLAGWSLVFSAIFLLVFISAYLYQRPAKKH